MTIEELIRLWKAEKPGRQNQNFPENPVGNELSDEELEEVLGGLNVRETRQSEVMMCSNQSVCRPCW